MLEYRLLKEECNIYKKGKEQGEQDQNQKKRLNKHGSVN